MSERTYRLDLPTIVRRLCPECGSGPIFRSAFVMHEHCPVCGLWFGRGQPGYFTGAMYVSYAMAIPIVVVFTVLEYLVLPDWTLFKLVLLAWFFCVPLIPSIWQYSRVVWIHFDQWIDPEADLGPT